jgi:hypothetical protein
MTCAVFFWKDGDQDAAYLAYWNARVGNAHPQPFMAQIPAVSPIDDRNRRPIKWPGYLFFEVVSQNSHFPEFWDRTVREIIVLEGTPLDAWRKLIAHGEDYLRARRILAHQRTNFAYTEAQLSCA